MIIIIYFFYHLDVENISDHFPEIWTFIFIITLFFVQKGEETARIRYLSV